MVHAGFGSFGSAAFAANCDALSVSDLRAIDWPGVEPAQLLPALREQFEQFKIRFNTILDAKSPPTFQNTVLAVDLASAEFDRIRSVYSVFRYNHRTPALDSIQNEINLISTDYSTLVLSDRRFYERVSRLLKKLTPGSEEYQITKGIHDAFLERGIQLSAADQEAMAGIHRRLGELATEFDRNRLILKNSVRIKVQNLEELKGLPEAALNQVRASQDLEGYYWIPLKNQMLVTQILEKVESSSFRKKVFFADFPKMTASKYITAEEAGETWSIDNRPVLVEIANLRQRLAQIQGRQHFAEGALRHRMAGTVERVQQFYQDLLPGLSKLVAQEKAELLQFVQSLNSKIEKVDPWDRSYYSSKLFHEKYRLDEDRLSEYFEVKRTVQSVLDFYSDLFDIRFEKVPATLSWLPDVEVYRIIDQASGKELSELHLDLYSRETKTAGAWKLSLQKAGLAQEGRQGSVMEITLNLNRAPGDQPTLLRINEVKTLFHELGHGVHEAFSKVKYQNLAGTSVARDFVEFPSQIMENWLMTPEFLEKGAIHYQTGERMPAEWIERIRESKKFRIGGRLRGQAMLGLIDLKWHTLTEPFPLESLLKVDELEKAIYREQGLEVSEDFSPTSPTFAHIFSGGYAMGYYSYLWGNIIEADGFEYWYSDRSKIKPKALQLKRVLLSQGGVKDPNQLYRAWTGRDFTPAAFLRRSGL
jgi:Zn-dependent oligopeptidase